MSNHKACFGSGFRVKSVPLGAGLAVRGIVSGIVFTLIAIGSAHSATIYVPDDYPAIQDAIDAAVNGDTVIVRPGTYVENIDFVGKAIAVKSELGAAVTTINGGSPANPDFASVVSFTSGEQSDSVLEGFTLTRGWGTFMVWPTIVGFCGGGIYCSGSSPTITRNIIIGNTADLAGGGIGLISSSNPVISLNTFTGNNSNGYAGAIYCWDNSSPDIKDNVITGNTCYAAGGGIGCEAYSSPFISRNIVSGNHAGNGGGGISYWDHSDPTIENNLICSNTTNRRGGGVNALMYALGTLVNNTIYGNSAADSGGGVICTENSNMTIVNTILWNNDAPVGPEIKVGMPAAPSTLTISHSDVEGGQAMASVGSGCTLNWGVGMIDADPLLFDPAGDDYHLTWQSPCINTGDSTAVTELFDFEDDPRIAAGSVDMGADEFYFHLYFTGPAYTGFPIELRVIGVPNMPVLLGMGSGIEDPPQSTPYGDLYLQMPLAGRWSLGDIPGNGVLTFPATIPLSWNPGEEYPFQALVGPLGDPNSRLTNLMKLEVDPGLIYVPDDKPTIQEAIDAVPDGGAVIVRPGVYVERISFKGKAITVKSEQGPSVTVIDGNRYAPVVLFASGEGSGSILDGFTITNGCGYNSGGIYCDHSSPTITNNIITGNTANNGGGIYCYYASPIIENNKIAMNTTSDYGGGIYCYESSLTVTNNIIIGNTADSGGGIYCYASDPSITNNAVLKNTAGYEGGGIQFYDRCVTTITNSTIYGNSAGSRGGGINCQRDCDITISNVILWDNNAPEGPEFRVASTARPSTVSISYSDVQGGQASVFVKAGCTLNWGFGMIEADPLFVTGPKGDYCLSQIAAGQTQDSPCVDTGDWSSSMIIGTTRTDEVQDSGIVDMGYHYPLP